MYDFAGNIDTTGRLGQIWSEARQRAAQYQAGQMAANGDVQGAQNALLGQGYFADADQYRQLQLQQQLQGAYKAAADQYAAGNQRGVNATMIGAGQPNSASTITGLNTSEINQQTARIEQRNAITSAANAAEDRKRTSALRVIQEMGNVARYAQTPEQYGQLMDALRKKGYDTTGYEDFNTGRPMLLGRAGITPQEADGLGSGAMKGVLGEAQVLAQGFIAEHPELKGREREIMGRAMEAAQSRQGLTLTPDGQIGFANREGSAAAQRQQAVDAMTRRSSPEGIAANTYARETAKSNATLEASKQRLVAVNDQIQNVRDLAGNENSSERKTFENSIGWLNSKSGKEFYEGQLPWGDADVPSVMFNLRAATHTLQDELAQYVATKGGSSDMRAKNAFEMVGELWKSPDVRTFMKRLDFLQKQLATIKDVPFINPVAPPWQQGAQAPQTPALQGAPGQAPTWEMTATGPNGHRIGLRGGVWYDAQTGERIGQ